MLRSTAFACAVLLLTCLGSRSNGQQKVVVYTALDQEFSEPLFRPFSDETGIEVRANFDTEATKSVGLANRLMTEALSRTPRCDVFWNNEIINTLRLKQRGLLRPVNLPNAKFFPDQYKSKDNRWFGFAARARILLANTKITPKSDLPDSIFDLTEPKWKNKVAIAKPLFGTTATHAACLFAALGEHRAKQFYLDLKDNGIQVLAGNKQVAQAVSAGNIAIGFTDTDDGIIECRKFAHVVMIFPDSKPNQLGTLFIPNTVAVLKSNPNGDAAERLANYLLSPSVEQALAAGPSAQIPLSTQVSSETQVKTPADVRAMDVDFEQSLLHWDRAMAFLGTEFLAEDSSPALNVAIISVLLTVMVWSGWRLVRKPNRVYPTAGVADADSDPSGNSKDQ